MSNVAAGMFLSTCNCGKKPLLWGQLPVHTWIFDLGYQCVSTRPNLGSSSSGNSIDVIDLGAERIQTCFGVIRCPTRLRWRVQRTG